MHKYKIIRLVTDKLITEKDKIKVVKRFINEISGRFSSEFLLTYGGFLSFSYDDELCEDIDILKPTSILLNKIFIIASEKINSFFDQLSESELNSLANISNYLTIGIDRENEKSKFNIELVAIYDLNKRETIHWTGKFYPLQRQERNLIRLPLESHFITINRKSLVVLGCHDLNVVSPRARHNSSKEGFRVKIQNEFDKLIHKGNYSVILHHPHFTNSKKTWKMSWGKIETDYPMIKHFASGLCVDNTRDFSIIESVIYNTQKGDVCSCVFLKDREVVFLK
jgi:hypothetical protein